MPISGDIYTFSDENLKIAPDAAGVYALYRGGKLTYIGRAQGGSTTIRSRLKDHKAGRSGPCTKQSDGYRREVCNNPASRERQLIDEYVQTHRKLPMCNDVRP